MRAIKQKALINGFCVDSRLPDCSRILFKNLIMKTLKIITLYLLGFFSLALILAEIDCGALTFFAVKMLAIALMYYSIKKLSKYVKTEDTQ